MSLAAVFGVCEGVAGVGRQARISRNALMCAPSGDHWNASLRSAKSDLEVADVLKRAK